MSSVLSKIKTSLRITHTALDQDLADSISACLADLRMLGIREDKLSTSPEVDPLILSALKLYVKGEYTDDTAKAARYIAGYDSLKSCLMMAEGYGREEDGTDE